MRGYKLVDSGIINQYGFQFEFNKKYVINGLVKYRENGFHFCTYPENTLRFSSERRPNDYTIVEVEASGVIECGDDYLENEEYGFTGMYASSEMTIIRVISREEIFNEILLSNNIYRIQRYIQLVNLNDIEISKIKEAYNDMTTNAYIAYYQFNDKEAFYKPYERKLKDSY